MANNRLETIRQKVAAFRALSDLGVLELQQQAMLRDVEWLLENVKCCAGHRYKCDKCSDIDERDGEDILFDDLRFRTINTALTIALDPQQCIPITIEAMKNGELSPGMNVRSFWIKQAKKQIGIDYKVGLEDE